MLRIVLNSNKFYYQEKSYREEFYTGYYSFSNVEQPTYNVYFYCNRNIFIQEDTNENFSFKKKIEDIEIESRSFTFKNKAPINKETYYMTGNISFVDYFITLLPLRKISTRKEIYTFNNDSEYHKITSYKIDFSLLEKTSLLKKIKSFLNKILC